MKQSTQTVRDATEKDIESLTRIKETAVLHRDRLIDAEMFPFRYLVLEENGTLIGFACLVFTRPDTWSNADDTSHLPQIVDLFIAEELRGKGYGSHLLNALEQIVAQQGGKEIFLAVEPVDNPRALALYQRLGYESLQQEPYPKHWEFTDSGSTVHAGEAWIIDMVKRL